MANDPTETSSGDEWPESATSHFRGRALPEPGVPAGYAALIQHYGLRTPLPPRLTALARRHHPSSTADWLMLTPRHRPGPDLAGHLAFAFKWEGLNLGVLAALFDTVSDREITDIVLATPTGAFARRLWFVHEWLTSRNLNVPEPRTTQILFHLDLREPQPQVRI